MSPNRTQLEAARAHEAAGRPDDALAAAWAALDSEPNGQAAKALVARILHENPKAITPERESHLRELLHDRDIDPSFVAGAGWTLVLRKSDAFPADPVVLARWLESDAFARELLGETFVTDLDVEIALTALRRWLLLSGRWREFPRAVEALTLQAAHNSGAWIFDAEERACLDGGRAPQMESAFRPRPEGNTDLPRFAEPVTRAVAGQYESWPYPAWSRISAPEPTTLAASIAKLDPDGPRDTAPKPEILVAGCGTGREAAIWARHYPDARITAIDISATSLSYGERRCAGLDNIAFELLDLHRASRLNRRFDAIVCSGVLHHLPDPEKGWAALVDVLKPGGVMHVMVYSKLARLRVLAARKHITDLLERPVDADLLREVRRRLIGTARGMIAGSRDFYTLGGVHDLLLHRHEDPFDVPRIRRALAQLGLELLAFTLPTRAQDARYRANNPADRLHRDFAAWAALEKEVPFLFAKMYGFWCRKTVR